MNNMKCQIQNHNDKLIKAVCMDKQCKKQRLCCLLCTLENHSTHLNKIVEIEDFNAFLENECNKQVNANNPLSYGQNQIIKGLEQLSTLTDTLSKKIRGEIQILQQQNLQKYLKNNCLIQQGCQRWNEHIENILQFVEIQNSKINQTIFEEGQLNQLDQWLLRIIKQTETSLEKIINQMNITSIKTIPLCFSEHRKNNAITIIDNSILKKSIQESYAMAFADEGFNPSNQSYEFAMCIQVKAEWVLVGVGNDEGNNLPNHLLTTMSWVTLGHGQYMTGHNHVFHHTDAAVNCKTNGMNFIVGDKIQIKYDHLTKVLEFRKESDQTITSMLITDMSKRLYPCVMLYYPGDQVELVQS